MVFILLCSCICYRGSMFTEPFPTNGRLFWFCYPGFRQTCHMYTNVHIWQLVSEMATKQLITQRLRLCRVYVQTAGCSDVFWLSSCLSELQFDCNRYSTVTQLPAYSTGRNIGRDVPLLGYSFCVFLHFHWIDFKSQQVAPFTGYIGSVWRTLNSVWFWIWGDPWLSGSESSAN
jgi:hypothetical protein